MAQRVTRGGDRGVRRLAAQLGLAAHMLPPSGSAPASPADAAADEADEVASEVDALADAEDDAEDEEDEDPAELSMGFGLSDSAGEELSSDLSLPHSFGRYDGVRPARAFGAGVSQFDDHLAAAPAAASTPPRRVGSAAIASASTTRAASEPTESGAGASEALMKKFYEAQVGRVRAQLVLATQTQRELESALQQERSDASSKLATLQSRHESERGRFQRENEQLKRENEQLASRLHVEKQHVASLSISDALAEQLARQPAEALSLRETIQLQLHATVRRLERELETCRQELEGARAMGAASQKAAADARDDLARLRDAADSRERKLLRDAELAEATRRELEAQVTSLYQALSDLKSEREAHEEKFRSQRQAMAALEAARAQLDKAVEERDAVASQAAELGAKLSESQQKSALLEADKAFLLDAKAQLELETAALRIKRQDLEAQAREWQDKYEAAYGQSLVLQSETRAQFERTLDDEMRKFMDVSRQEIDRIRSSAQVVYERENRLLKDARDGALQQVEALEARLQTVQARLDEKVLEATRLDSQHSTALAGVRNELKMKHFEMNQLQLSLEDKAAEIRATRLEVDMLSQKLSIHKDEFARLETTSSTKIAQLEAALELERSKLKEYELLEVDLDNAVLQTGEALSSGAKSGGADAASDSVREAMSTFGAIPTTTKRRFEQSVQLAQRVVQSQREALAQAAKLKEAVSDRARLEQQVSALQERLSSLHQPQAYLIDKLRQREEELRAATRRRQEADERLQELRAELQRTVDARNALQRQLQQLLGRRQEVDALKATVLALRARLLHAGSLAPGADESEDISGGSAPQVTGGGGGYGYGYVKAPPSPAPSVASRMTQAPARESTSPEDTEIGAPDAQASAGDSATPRWYSKLRT